MARITTHRGTAKDRHNYYLADYYDAGQEFAGQWLGSGAERLGLQGKVDSKQFMYLLKIAIQTAEKISLSELAAIVDRAGTSLGEAPSLFQ